MKNRWAVAFGLAAIACGVIFARVPATFAADPLGAQIAQVRAATVHYHDVNAAFAAGHGQFLGCISQPGEGAMGIHFPNLALVMDTVLDPLRPEVVIYEPKANGQLHLVALEYIVFKDAWDAEHSQPPSLFGQTFHHVGSPNRYGLPPFYELHVWAWKHNPRGMFYDWKPQVTCPGS